MSHIVSDFAPFQRICNPLGPVKHEKKKTFFNTEQTAVTPLVFFPWKYPKSVTSTKEIWASLLQPPELAKKSRSDK